MIKICMILKYMVITGLACVFYDFIDYLVGTIWLVAGWLFFMSILRLGARHTVSIRVFKEPISKGAIRLELIVLLNLIYYMVIAIIRDDLPRYIGFGMLILAVTIDVYNRWKNFCRIKKEEI